MPMPKEYVHVPVEAAKYIALAFAKQQVVIIAADTVHNKFHTATYGVDARDKVIAARMGEVLTRQVGGEVDKAVFSEDFRKDFDAGKYKEALELLQSVQTLLNQIPLVPNSSMPRGRLNEIKTAIENFLKPKPGCSLDTDGDGNCPIHPNGCPK